MKDKILDWVQLKNNSGFPSFQIVRSAVSYLYQPYRFRTNFIQVLALVTARLGIHPGKRINNMAATTTPSVSVNHLSGPAMSAVFKSLMESQADYPQIRDLSRREVEVMQAFLSPVSDYDNVSSDLNITKKTLENHLANVFSKLGVDNIKKAVWRFVLIYTEYLPKFLFFYVAPAAEAEYMAA